ncbi:beta-1,3-galactosyltransferase 1-like [Mercenaria mercenaria]|uniref:beta-1,3-galactosyltransferase 1-like n=1 Tax=Mercenaria mercenaria TaxID=6596 RepID=UPI00234ED41B|nr:beta-1,3-galactosyltransferase 1-like [Mercenaria mercenaria]XP_053408602.1 beta-1,3-galactosyltransferase 1-like [Mercenaria mercenaria]
MNTYLSFILLLLCACAAVNLLFYSHQSFPVQHHPTESFVDLEPEDLTSSGTFQPDTTAVREQIPGTTRAKEKWSGTGRKSSFRKLHNANQDKMDRSATIFSFSVNNHTVCIRNTSDESEQWDLVVVIISKVDHFLQRNAIRNTWASELSEINALAIFIVGQSDDNSINRQVRKEAELYNDLIQVELKDDYNVLTLKSIAMLQWLDDFCSNSKFYLKSDDDMYINIGNVIREFTQCKEERFFLCHVFKNAPPIRDQFSKWYVSSKEFPQTFYPTYCSGTAYGFSSSIVSDLYRSSAQANLFRMEDVFITGIAAESIYIKHVHSWGFSFSKRQPTGCAFQNASTGHEVTVKEMYVIFAQLENKEIDCSTKENLYLLKAENEN